MLMIEKTVLVSAAGCALLLGVSPAASGQAPDAARGLAPIVDYWDYFPDWSPDGTRIAFSSSRATHPALSIFVVDVETGRVEQVTHNAVAPGDSDPRWSPDGSRIAFASNREGNSDIYVVRTDGSGLRNITAHPANDAGFDWSPDGRRIVFGSNRDGDHDLYTMNDDGSDVRRLTTLSGSIGSPAWSPDGSRIAFAWNREGNWELYSIAPDGAEPTRLTWHWAWDGHPAWSPDGKHLAFWSDRDDFWFELYVMDADGADVRRLTRSPDWDLNPDWSPDGRQIAWHSSSGRYGIEVINADGTGRRRLTSAEPGAFGRMVREAGVDAALAALRRARARSPDSSFVHYGEIWALGEELLALGDTLGAITLHEAHPGLVTGPQYLPYAYEGLGRVYRAVGRPAPPSFAEFFRLIRTRGVAQARSVFDEAKRRFPDWVVFSEFRMNRLGYEYLNRGWIHEAIALFELNTRAYPNSANAFDSLAEAHLRSGDRAGAIALYEKVVSMDPDGPAGQNASRMLTHLKEAEARYR